MAARTDFEPWTWEEAEQNRGASPVRRKPEELNKEALLQERASVDAKAEPLLSSGRRAASVREECDRLQTEIKRGREYLAQVTHKLDEHRHLLEEWPVYERHCGQNPLANLTDSILLNERIIEFLRAWLTRRENRLAELSHRAAVVPNSVKRAVPGLE
ncbi:MAG TPA: hypothetical protein VN673_06770 [Clostridia bacterium]|nr:hypothetical protein [Clostridia bacterium]